MKENKYITTAFITAEDLKRIRKKFGVTQKEFAEIIHVSKPTVERWERSDEKITGPVVLLIQMLDRYPDFIDSIKVPKKEFPLRLWYMHGQKVCSIIDVDEMRHKILVTNYTDHIMFRAFGTIENPTFEMYEEFLESRCFPRTRDKLKLVLEDLGLPFYDPFMIIEKTEGRMAEDDFWIRIER